MVIGCGDLGRTQGSLGSSPLDLPQLEQLRILATFFTYQNQLILLSLAGQFPFIPPRWKNQDQSDYTLRSVPIAPSR